MSFPRLVWLLTTVICAAFLGLVHSQELGPNEREVITPAPKAGTSDLYTLDFKFKDPRIVKVHVPGRGTRICWYLWYQVINRTGKPVRFNPVFELVTHDYPGVFIDESLPTAEAAVRKLEDPDSYLHIKSTIEMWGSLIPVSRPPEEAFPRAVTGMAIWDAAPTDLKNREAGKRDLTDTTQFSIFVRGLSNGFVLVDPPAPGLPPQAREKTLQLKFRRQGDRFSTDSRDMVYLPPAEWTYRATSRTLIPDAKAKAPAANVINP